MNDITKIGASHLGRAAYIYLRQSTPAQVEHNRESTQRQYALASRATTLGWPSQQVIVVDEGHHGHFSPEQRGKKLLENLKGAGIPTLVGAEAKVDDRTAIVSGSVDTAAERARATKAARARAWS